MTSDAVEAVRTAPALAGPSAAVGGTGLDLVAEQARTRPGAPAVVHGAVTLGYGDLWRRVELLATVLAGQGVGRGQVVGLAARRSADLVVAVLGIHRSGAACLPLDPDYPEQRLRFMLSDSAATLVVGHEDVLARVVPPGLTTISLEAVAGLPARDEPRPPMPRPSDACYVLYTSGSTGTPKGVVQEHRTIANLVVWQRENSPCGKGSRTAQFAPISFDVSFQEIFCTLATGGTLVCVDEAARRDPVRLWRVLAEQSVHRLFLPYAALSALSVFADQVSWERIVLREVITAGEQLQCTAPVRSLFRRMPSCRLVNQYGPTETHVVTSHRLEPDVAGWPMLPPIGRPIRGVRAHVLDAGGQPVPTGDVGELWLGGAMLAREYWRRPDLTGRRFRPELSHDGTRIGHAYRTGDLVRVTTAGELEFAGRADDQVKIRGTRVEPGEVEAVLLDYPGVRAAAVVAHGTSATGRVLIAYVVGISGREQLTGLRAHTRERLPEAFVPARFQPVGELPLTPSGKVDRSALRAFR